MSVGAMAAGAVLMVVSLGCATLVTTLKLDDVGREKWPELKAIGDDVAARFGFVSDAEEFIGHEVGGDVKWVVVGSYSNRYRGLRGIRGGDSHVEFFIFARPETTEAEITIEDYGNADRTEYVKALETAFTKALRDMSVSASTQWQTDVVHGMEP